VFIRNKHGLKHEIHVLYQKNMFKPCFKQKHVCLFCLLGSKKRGFARSYVQTCFQVLIMFIHVYFFPGGSTLKPSMFFKSSKRARFENKIEYNQFITICQINNVSSENHCSCLGPQLLTKDLGQGVRFGTPRSSCLGRGCQRQEPCLCGASVKSRHLTGCAA
jgi:hypothetical protein